MDLAIFIGNDARGDDGAARELARRLEGAPGLRLISAPQLDVAMAEDVARARSVVFVDAERRESPPLSRSEVRPAPLTAGPTSHLLDPAGLLALARTLYGGEPEAELLTLAAPEMGHSERLSPTAAEAVAAGEALLRERAAAGADPASGGERNG